MHGIGVYFPDRPAGRAIHCGNIPAGIDSLGHVGVKGYFTRHRQIALGAIFLDAPGILGIYIKFIDADGYFNLKLFRRLYDSFPMSLSPETDGSVTINTMSTPRKEAMTGQPMPGDPSIMANGTEPAAFFISSFTALTSKPEFPLPF